MKSRRLFVTYLALLSCALLSIPKANAQSPGVLYTWNQSFGEATGPNVEGWAFDFGGNALVLDNTADGELTIAETGSTVGSDWAVRDSFGRIRESTNPADLGGLDLTGLSSIELEIGHNGSNPVNGQIYAHTLSGASSCCDFNVLGGITVNPGAPQIVSVPLTAIAANYDAISFVRTIGLQIFDHATDGNLTWTVREVRSVGTPLTERYVAKHDGATGPTNLDGAVVKFDQSAISGGIGDAQVGLSVIASDTGGSSALRWVDLGGGPGAAVAWGNNRATASGLLAVDYNTRPMDLSNYSFVTVRMRAQPGVGADSSLGVQFFTQAAVPGNEYSFQAPGSLSLPVDSLYHELTFSLAGLQGMNAVQWTGINLDGHAGNMDIRVDYVRFFSPVPEPGSAGLLIVGACMGLLIQVRKWR